MALRIHRVLVPIHALILLQLVPVPPSMLAVISPGSYAAWHIPGPSSGSWTAITASPIGTRQAWLFVAGLHGLAISLLASAPDRRLPLSYLYYALTGAGVALALEGLVQAASPHPHWLYGIWRVPGAGSHEAGIFGPYYNRDHYANVIAIAASLAAALLARLLSRLGKTSLLNSPDFGKIVGLGSGLAILMAAGAAAGSRGGLAAMLTGIVVGSVPLLISRPRLGLALGGLAVIVFFGTGVPSAFERMGDVDFENSRLIVWRDALRLLEFFPLFGCGIGAFAPAYWPYQRVVRFEYWPHAHNEYLQWVFEAGTLGCLLALFWARGIWKLLPTLIKNEDLRPAIAAVIAAAIHAVVDCSPRIPANGAWTAVLLFCLAVGPVRLPKAASAAAER
jgi:O-antigen ligase